MSQNSNNFYSQQYATNVEMLLQQKTAKFPMAFSPMSAVGKSATVVNQIGALEADERTVRYDDIAPGDPVMTRPWVFPRAFDKAVFFDTFDQMRMEANPQSEFVQTLAAAIQRRQDDECIRAFFADRLIGEAGTTTDSFPAAQQVSVNTGGTGSGINVEKLQNAIQILEEAEVDLDSEQLWCAISPKQKRNLMNEIEVTSGDFFKGQVMTTRNPSGFLSINFIVTNRLLANGSSQTRCPVWVPSGMKFCTWNGGTMTDVSQRKDKRGMPWQAYTQGTFGAVRKENARVVEIPCV